MAATLTGVRELQRRLNAVERESVPRYLELWQLKTIAGAKDRLKPHKKTGVTEGSLQRGPITKHSAEVEVGGAGIFLEFGTKDHAIPKSGVARRPMPLAGSRRLSGSLRSGQGKISARGDGMPAFAWRVHHPGTKATPFLMPAALIAADDADWPKCVYKPWNGAA